MNKNLIASEIFKHLELYPQIQVTQEKFCADMIQLPEDTLLFIYQGLAEIEDIHH